MDVTDPPLDLTFNGSSGQAAARQECHLGVQRSEAGLNGRGSRRYHCQRAGMKVRAAEDLCARGPTRRAYGGGGGRCL